MQFVSLGTAESSLLVQRLLLELNKNQCDAMFVLLGAVKMRRDRTETEEEVGSKARKGRNITTF